MMAKLNSTLLLTNPTGVSAGFVLWVPDCHPDTEKIPDPRVNTDFLNLRNCFVGLTDDPSLNFVNISTNPFGKNPLPTPQAPDSKVYYIDDPAANFLKSDIVSSARTNAASMKLTYTGNLLDMGGEVCPIGGLALESIFQASGDNTAISVDDLFKYSAGRQRFTDRTVEIVYDPPSTGCFRDQITGPYAFSEFADSKENATYVTEVGKAEDMTIFGFAFRGLPQNSASPVSVDLYKTIEWKPEAISGIVGNTHRAPPAPGHAPVVHARSKIHKSHPGWATRFFDSVEKEAITFAKKNINALVPYAMQQAPQLLRLL